jgi:hypothetical protein
LVSVRHKLETSACKYKYKYKYMYRKPSM